MKEKTIIGLCGGLIAYVIGSINLTTIILAIFMILDFITGTGAAIVRKEKYSKEKAIRGLWKKAATVILWGVAVLIEIVIKQEGAKAGIDINGAFITMAITFYLLGSEIWSVLTNLREMGAKAPEWLFKIAKSMRNAKGEYHG